MAVGSAAVTAEPRDAVSCDAGNAAVRVTLLMMVKKVSEIKIASLVIGSGVRVRKQQMWQGHRPWLPAGDGKNLSCACTPVSPNRTSPEYRAMFRSKFVACFTVSILLIVVRFRDLVAHTIARRLIACLQYGPGLRSRAGKAREPNRERTSGFCAGAASLSRPKPPALFSRCPLVCHFSMQEHY